METMTAEQAAEWGKTLDFPTVWAALVETGKKLDQTRTFLNEVGARVDQVCARVDRVCENVGGLNRSVGELIETLIAGNLWEKFPQYGLKMAYRRLQLYDDERKSLKTDVDILLVDTEYAMAVEVKREPDVKDVDKHLKRMELVRAYWPLQVKADKLIGAIAGGCVPAEVKDYAHECGFYVIELSGEQINLIHLPNGFVPREWEGLDKSAIWMDS